jgi:hypothetical protein
VVDEIVFIGLAIELPADVGQRHVHFPFRMRRLVEERAAAVLAETPRGIGFRAIARQVVGARGDSEILALEARQRREGRSVRPSADGAVAVEAGKTRGRDLEFDGAAQAGTVYFPGAFFSHGETSLSIFFGCFSRLLYHFKNALSTPFNVTLVPI